MGSASASLFEQLCLIKLCFTVIENTVEIVKYFIGNIQLHIGEDSVSSFFHCHSAKTAIAQGMNGVKVFLSFIPPAFIYRKTS